MVRIKQSALSALALCALSLALAGPVQAQAPFYEGVQQMTKPVLGVGVVGIEFPRLEQLALSHGVLIERLMPGGPAEQAGIKRGDIVTALNGEPVYSPQRLQWLTSRLGETDQVALEVVRDGERQTLSIDVAARRTPPMAPARQGGSYLGIQMQPMTRQLAEAKGTDHGVLIGQVLPDTPAAEAGLQQGDVILRMDRKTIRAPSDVYSVLNFFEPGDTLDIALLRDNGEQTTQLTLGESPLPDSRRMRPPMPRDMLPPGFYWPAPFHHGMAPGHGKHCIKVPAMPGHST